LTRYRIRVGGRIRLLGELRRSVRSRGKPFCNSLTGFSRMGGGRWSELSAAFHHVACVGHDPSIFRPSRVSRVQRRRHDETQRKALTIFHLPSDATLPYSALEWRRMGGGRWSELSAAFHHVACVGHDPSIFRPSRAIDRSRPFNSPSTGRMVCVQAQTLCSVPVRSVLTHTYHASRARTVEGSRAIDWIYSAAGIEYSRAE
jgi:hypothetical protein